MINFPNWRRNREARQKASVVDAIEVFIGFGKWLQHRATNDEELTPELIKAINRFQDLYVSELLSTKGQ